LLPQIFKLVIVLRKSVFLVFELALALDAVRGVHFITERIRAVAKQLLHVLVCMAQFFLDFFSETLVGLLHNKLVLQDLLNRKSAGRVERADFLEQVFKRSACFVRAVDLPEFVFLFASKSFEVRVLRHCSAEWRKL
jgi:hypothetical protein